MNSDDIRQIKDATEIIKKTGLAPALQEIDFQYGQKFSHKHKLAIKTAIDIFRKVESKIKTESKP